MLLNQALDRDAVQINGAAYSARRAFVWIASGNPLNLAPALPAAGVRVDGVTGAALRTGEVNTVLLASRGRPVWIEASASFAANSDLVTGADGRVATGAGVAIARSLAVSAGAGAIVPCVMA